MFLKCNSGVTFLRIAVCAVSLGWSAGICAQSLQIDRQHQVVNAQRFASPENQNAEISITYLSEAFVTQGNKDTLRIDWQPTSRTCRLYFTTRPGGGDPANYPNMLPDAGKGSLRIVGGLQKLEIGSYYCILRDVNNPTATSVEFLIFVQPQVPVRMLGPMNTLDLRQEQPVFRWQPISGVPYYFVVVSQGDLEVITDPRTGDIEKVIGVNFVWQAMTTNTSIRYGETDPSGTWPDSNTPPLLPGETYNWLVFSAFGPDLRFVAWDLYPLSASKFVVAAPTLAGQPEILAPAENAQLATDEITFRWRRVPPASRYRLLLQQFEEEDVLGEGTIIFWQHVTIDTVAKFRARDFLTASKYRLQVIAENPAAVSRPVSHEFNYRKHTGHLDIMASEVATEVLLPFADITVRGTQQIGLPFPLYTFLGGHLVFDLPVGEYTVAATVRGYLPGTANVTVAENDSQKIDIRLQQAPLLINGRVIPAGQDGTPVAFATVTVPEQQMSMKTDGLGSFSLAAAVQPPPVGVVISALGYQSQTVSNLQFSARGIADLGDITLVPADAAVSGKLLDAAGLPLSGVRFAISGQTQNFDLTLGASGHYDLGLQSGSWEIRPFYEGYFAEPEKYTFDLLPAENRQASFVFYDAALLDGRIFANGKPLGGGTISLLENSRQTHYSTRADNFGTFRFDVPAGSYALRVDTDGYAPYAATVDLIEGKATTIDVQVQKLSIIWGYVWNDETQQPLTTAEIIDNGDGSVLATSAPDGKFAFPATAGKTYTLDAVLPGFVSTGPKSAAVGAGDSGRVDLAMQPAAAIIRGKVTGPRGPVADARVVVQENNMTVRTNTAGQFEISVQPGTYRLRAAAKCYPADEQSISVQLGETATVDFELKGEVATVRGHIYDLAGAPLAEASILAAGENNFTARSDSTGLYELCADPGAYFVLVTRVGYLSASTSLILAANDSLSGIDFHLQDNFATIRGKTQTFDGLAIADVQVILSNAWQQMVTRSDAQGNFSFMGVYPGDAVLITRSSTYSASPMSITLLGKQTVSPVIQMYRSDGHIAGAVVNGYSGAGIDSALVTVQVSGGSSFFSTYSQAPAGAFRLDNLPVVPNSFYKIFVNKSGFLQKAPVDSIAVNSDTVVVQLLGTNAAIAGIVRAADVGSPVADATIAVSRSGDPVRQTQTGANGSFIVPGLVFTYEYQLAINHPRYVSGQFTVNAPVADRVFALQHHVATAKGQVVAGIDSVAYTGARVVFTNIDGVGRNDTAHTSTDGRFQKAIWPGAYQVSAEAPLYFSRPAQRSIALVANAVSPELVFLLERQQLQTLTVQGPEEILNTARGTQYMVSAIDTSGRSINEVPNLQWSVDVGSDTAQIDNRGVLTTHHAFLGRLQISVHDSVSGAADALDVNVVANLVPTAASTFFGRNGERLDFAAGTVSSATTVKLETIPLSPVQNIEKSFRVLEPVYRLVPENAQFSQPALLTLPAAKTISGEVAILRWDNLISGWEQNAAATNRATGSDRLTREITRGGDYAVVEYSRPLAIQSLQLRPNPVSPDLINEFGEHGIAIIFTVTSNQAALPLVTAEIYNLEGNLVAVLARQKPMPKGTQHFSWAGETHDGRLARNGRYALRFLVEDGKDRRELMKSIVLIR